MTFPLLLATNNPHKITEIREILATLPIDILTPSDLSLTLTIAEDGDTYFENARKKAVAFQQASGLTVLADDSGLEVAALHGSPGIHSHRFLPAADATDKDRRDYLLSRLHGLPQPWLAAFHCEVVLVNCAQHVFRAHGQCLGQIITPERGDNGFGYDAVFEVDGYRKTMAELPAGIKNQVSHRAQALRAALPFIKSLLES